MTYREYIYDMCKSADLTDEEQVTVVIQRLAKDCIMYHDMVMDYEQKIKELMTASDYEKWITDRAKEMFKKEVYAMEDGEFKGFCLENMSVILEDDQ